MNGSSYTFTINVNGTQATGTLNTVSQSAVAATSVFNSLGHSIRKMGECAFAFNNINQGLQMMRDKLDSAIAPGVELNTSLMDLSAVTGVTGKGLKEIEMYARKAAKTFGGSAADGAEAYKLILSQLSPEIAKVPKALALMGTHIKTTSKTMGNDTRAAAEVLTTAMNQFQVSLSDPMQAAAEMGNMMNIMSAAAKEGSAELPAIKSALEQCGMAAKAAEVSFSETNAAIQVLDKAGKKGSEGGVALRNVMATLVQGRFLPKDVQEELQAAGVKVSTLTDKSLSLADRLKSLQGVMSDDALLSKLFGKENANAALALLSSIPAVEGYTAAIQGTNTATEQAQVIMGGYAERMSRMQAWLDDLKISFFNFTGSIMPMVTGVVTFFQGTASVMMGVNAIACFSESAWGKAIGMRTKAMIKGTGAMFGHIGATLGSISSMGVYNALTLASVATTYGFSYALKAVSKAIYAIPIIGWIAAGIALLITAFKILWEKCEGFRRILFAAWEVVKAVFYNIGVVVKSLWDNILKPYLMFWWNLVKAVASGIWSALKWCWDGIVAGFSAVGNFFVSLWDGIMSGVSAIGDFFSGIWGWIKDTCGSAIDWIVSAFNKITEPIKAVFAPVWDFVSGIFSKIGEVVSKFFGWISGLWNKLFPKDKFKDLGEAAQTGLTKGSENWRRSQEAKKKAGISETQEMPVMPETAKSTAVQTAVKTTAKTKKKKGEVVDLANIKGSTDYAAIAAKMAPVKIGGLSGGQAPATVKSLPQQPKQPTGRINPGKQEYGIGQKTDYLAEIAQNVRKIAAGIALIGSMQMVPAAPSSPAVNTINSVAVTNQTTTSPVLQSGNTALSGIAEDVRRLADVKQPDRFFTETVSPLQPNTGKKQSGERKDGVSFGKFCDTVIIQVPAGTTQDQAEVLYRELMKRINDAQS